ncbi:tRNA preQ1(34) S-adenosylmethionine ribosyltransferase-isomerase QueA [Nitratifractor salsuginis]|uniref:S-adenosylmethionine:tRNA ribosyltransferase-isomerase n=1 Tax=Nitratifractor salsuginis (strain DSM 16511 / JCM 12458 / E9I37-1) TaxID=749222 RepID=E6X1G8_NITSE|nr:tRNA preQ1(34) S-adenosylmethionine ribosyltransferase-isomerase QueA [Nitratifractor salsuginis]ADV45901.1 S-adenosylmethionine/tRNA-ribosyltransferase-isomerase [Nitratifractor salsuginis DSM 16511]
MKADELDWLTQSYDYTLPPKQIATQPVEPPDAARMLVFDRRDGSIHHARFRDLERFLPSETALFLNDTRVIKARLYGTKATGGRVELLLNKPLPDNEYLAMIRGRVREGTRLSFDEGLQAEVRALLPDGARRVRFYQEDKELDFSRLVEILERIGHVPLPPYMNREDTPEDTRHYQSLFAREAGAVAAPTASLHFTPEQLERLKSTHPCYTLTLHVGAGTFKPVESEKILEHPMHSEYFRIPPEAAEYLRGDAPLLAVGTTVTRTVEYFARTSRTEGECDLFLHPGNPPRRVNHLLTNFHLPKSTLIMLVSAFIGREKTLELYREAIREGYRFYSYGDAMLIL